MKCVFPPRKSGKKCIRHMVRLFSCDSSTRFISFHISSLHLTHLFPHVILPRFVYFHVTLPYDWFIYLRVILSHDSFVSTWFFQLILFDILLDDSVIFKCDSSTRFVYFHVTLPYDRFVYFHFILSHDSFVSTCVSYIRSIFIVFFYTIHSFHMQLFHVIHLFSHGSSTWLVCFHMGFFHGVNLLLPHDPSTWFTFHMYLTHIVHWRTVYRYSVINTLIQTSDFTPVLNPHYKPWRRFLTSLWLHFFPLIRTMQFIGSQHVCCDLQLCHEQEL